MPGQDAEERALCDDCMTIARPWDRGRAALMYRDNGRRLVLALKHGDRMDLARPASARMLKAAQPILKPEMLVVPVPLHWMRLFRRRFNQAALLSRAIAKATHLDHCPDALARTRTTGSQEGKTRDELAKVEVLPKFEHFGGTRSRLGLGLTIAYDELAKMA